MSVLRDQLGDGPEGRGLVTVLRDLVVDSGRYRCSEGDGDRCTERMMRVPPVYWPMQSNHGLTGCTISALHHYRRREIG